MESRISGNKSAMSELNNRFVEYVNRVRQLKDENDIIVINQSIAILEQEIRSLKQSYEHQISQLKSTLDIIVTEKCELESDLAARRSAESRLNDRLCVESSKNGQLMRELNALRSEMSGKEQQVISMSLALKQGRLESGDVAETCDKLRVELHESRAVIDNYETEMRRYQNELHSLTQKLEFQDRFFNDKMEAMKVTLEQYLQKLVEMDFKMEAAKSKEAEWPMILNRLKITSQQEFDRFKSDAETYVNERISHLQKQLNAEVCENNALKQSRDELNIKLLDMRKQESITQSKIDDLERQKQILEKTMKSDKQNSEKTNLELQGKLKKFQEEFLQKFEAIKNQQSSQESSANIQVEIEFLNRLLAEEERRLQIRTDSFQGMNDRIHEYNITTSIQQQIQHSNNNDRQTVLQSGAEIISSKKSLFSKPTEEECEEEPLVSEEFEESKAAERIQDQVDQILSDEEGVERFINGDRQIEQLYQSQTKDRQIVGPVLSPDQIVGPIHDEKHGKLSSNDISSNNVSRPFSANIRGIRTAVVNKESDDFIGQDERDDISENDLIGGYECNTGVVPRNDSGLGQSPDYFDTVFRSTSNQSNTPTNKELLHSMSLSNVRVLEVNKEGKFIKICNSSETMEVEIGGYVLKQNRFGHPISLFRFPDRVKLPPNATVNIWSGSNDPLVHQPPTDFYCPDPALWGFSAEYTTILCNASGQAVSWTTPTHRINPDPYSRAKTAPSSRRSTSSQPNSREKSGLDQKLPEIISSKMPNYNDQPDYMTQSEMSARNASAGVPHFPYTSSVKVPGHPCQQDSSRGTLVGNDNSSLNRQTRQLSNSEVPEHMIGQPYTGTNSQRLIGGARVMKYTKSGKTIGNTSSVYPAPIIQKSHSYNNRSNEILLRSNTEPPSIFQKPQARFNTGLEQVQSMHNSTFQAPMFKPIA